MAEGAAVKPQVDLEGPPPPAQQAELVDQPPVQEAQEMEADGDLQVAREEYDSAVDALHGHLVSLVDSAEAVAPAERKMALDQINVFINNLSARMETFGNGQRVKFKTSVILKYNSEIIAINGTSQRIVLYQKPEIEISRPPPFCMIPISEESYRYPLRKSTYVGSKKEHLLSKNLFSLAVNFNFSINLTCFLSSSPKPSGNFVPPLFINPY